MHSVLDLGSQPAADEFLAIDDLRPQDVWPLVVGWCDSCTLLQLIGGDEVGEQPMLAVVSGQVETHALNSARKVVAQLGLRPGDTFQEFHSNHGGGWAAALAELGLRELSVDDREQPMLIVDVQWLTHQHELVPALVSHAQRLAPGGRVVLDFHHALPLMEQGQVDAFRHGHFVYMSLLALEPAFAAAGLVAINAVRTPTFGGGLQVTAAAGGAAPTVAGATALEAIRAAEREVGLSDLHRMKELGLQATAMGAALREHLIDAQARGRRVLGYGAPSRAALLLTLGGIDEALLSWTADLSPAKHGLRLPGTRIAIRSPQELIDAQPDEVLILTWDIADEVAQQLISAGLRDAELFTAAPRPRRVASAPDGDKVAAC